MEPRPLGYFEASVPGIGPGTRYTYLLDGTKDRPDPASRFQPDGVHQPSAVVDPHGFTWTDGRWTGVPLPSLIIYELHPGTVSAAGTFEGIIRHLDYLRETVGVTAIEMMPVAQFPGRRNWGYDGVFPFAPQASYGGPQGLKTLVDACHARGLAVILDVVYNHLGPEGNYLGDFGPYFTDHYRTPWGQAINYDGPDSDEVRHFVISNALYWITEYHMDGLRLDAIHGIYDFGAQHILQELSEAVHALGMRLGRTVSVIAESDLNDTRVIAPRDCGGHGLDAQWNDDFHHALHTLLTGERRGYYQDFGRLDQMATAFREGFVYSGQRSPSRRRRHGNSALHRPLSQFVVCAQNHDQIGNRALGDRLSTLVSTDGLKIAAAAVLLAPKIPLLFMGEEYAETAPFLYFTDHGDPELVEAVRRGRRAEFAAFGWTDAIPDPQDMLAFERSRVALDRAPDDLQAAVLRWYHRLIQLRKSVASLATADSDRYGCQAWTFESQKVLVLHRWVKGEPGAILILGFNRTPVTISLNAPVGTWKLSLDSGAQEFGGTAPARDSVLQIGSTSAVELQISPTAAVLYLEDQGPRGKNR